MKYLAIFVISFLSAFALATDGVVNEGKVTKVRAYESTDGATNVYISINNQSRVGPNPDYPNTNCELWTYTQEVYSLALTAKTSGQRVNVRYVSNGTSEAFCKVRYIELID